jgi:hypothetical protein
MKKILNYMVSRETLREIAAWLFAIAFFFAFYYAVQITIDWLTK